MMMINTRNKQIRIFLYFVWILTILIGLLESYYNDNVAAMIFSALAVILTVFCVANMIKTKYGNICLGICQLYLSLIGLTFLIKALYWKFAISLWYLVIGIIIIVLFDLFVVWRFFKKNKEIKETKIVHARIVLGLMFLISIILPVYINETFPSNPISILEVFCILYGIVLIFASSAAGVRNLVLEDDRILYHFRITIDTAITSMEAFLAGGTISDEMMKWMAANGNQTSLVFCKA